MSEYCAAINCIKEMGNLPFSGITREDMSRQCEKFVEVMKDIINRKAVKDRLGDISKLVHFVFYDGMLFSHILNECLVRSNARVTFVI
jgi:hypothetical protein